MIKAVFLLFILVSSQSFASSYWYDYCRPMKEVYSFVAEKYPAEVFEKDEYGRCGIDCEMTFSQNLFKTKAIFNISILSATREKFDFRVIYKMNTRNDGSGICRMVKFEDFLE